MITEYTGTRARNTWIRQSVQRYWIVVTGLMYLIVSVLLVSYFKLHVEDEEMYLSPAINCKETVIRKSTYGMEAVNSPTETQDWCYVTPDRECISDTKAVLERHWGIDIHYMCRMLDVPQEVYDTLIRIVGMIRAAEPLDASSLPKINQQVSEAFNNVIVVDIRKSRDVEVYINREKYMLKNLGKIHSLDNSYIRELDFALPYDKKVLMAFGCMNQEWLILGRFGLNKCIFRGACPKQRIWLMARDGLHDLNRIHSQEPIRCELQNPNHLHSGDLLAANNLGGRNTSQKQSCAKLAHTLIAHEISAVLTVIAQHLTKKTEVRSADTQFQVIECTDGRRLHFEREDEAMADFLLVCLGYVEHLPTEFTSLLQHHYITGASKPDSDIFGSRLYTVRQGN